MYLHRGFSPIFFPELVPPLLDLGLEGCFFSSLFHIQLLNPKAISFFDGLFRLALCTRSLSWSRQNGVVEWEENTDLIPYGPILSNLTIRFIVSTLALIEASNPHPKINGAFSSCCISATRNSQINLQLPNYLYALEHGLVIHEPYSGIRQA